MKFYEVQDEYGDYTAIIWAKDEAQATQAYHKNVADVESLTVEEVPVDEVYTMMVKGFEKDKNQNNYDFGVMGLLRDIISSNAFAIVLTRGVD